MTKMSKLIKIVHSVSMDKRCTRFLFGKTLGVYFECENLKFEVGTPLDI